MIAELSSNTYQTYPPFYDQLVSGWCVPQNPTPNPNCFQNAVRGSIGIGRPFFALAQKDGIPRPDDPTAHNGWHSLSPNYQADAVTLPALAGTVIDISRQSTKPGALLNVYVKPDVGNFIVYYTDLLTKSVGIGQHLGPNDKIGTVRPGDDPRNGIGLHISLVVPEYYNDFRKAQREAAKKNTWSDGYRKWFIDPNSAASPIRCP